MSEKILIFDFDGTIADSMNYVVEIFNGLSGEFRFKPIQPEELGAMRDKTATEVLRHTGISTLKVPTILARAHKEFKKNLSDIQPITGIRDVLQQLGQFVTRMGIVSSNAEANIEEFLGNHDLNMFDFIHGTTRLLSKNVSLKKLLSEKNFDPDNVFYIGDETRDVVAAKKVGICSIAVTWGYNSKKVLQAGNPDFLVSDPGELLKILG